MSYLPKVKVEVVIEDHLTDQVVETITKTANTDKIGDGKIFVTEVYSALRIRTGETGSDAI